MKNALKNILLQQIESKSAPEFMRLKNQKHSKLVVKIYCKSSANFTWALTIRVAALDFVVKECFPGSNLHY